MITMATFTAWFENWLNEGQLAIPQRRRNVRSDHSGHQIVEEQVDWKLFGQSRHENILFKTGGYVGWTNTIQKCYLCEPGLLLKRKHILYTRIQIKLDTCRDVFASLKARKSQKGTAGINSNRLFGKGCSSYRSIHLEKIVKMSSKVPKDSVNIGLLDLN